MTSSLMSSHRGDGIFNPKPIPDLAGEPAKLKVSRDPQKGELRNFIFGLITQEFDGPPPPPAVLDGLAAYVRSLSPAACKGAQTTDVKLDEMLDDVDAAVRLAKNAYAVRDRPAGRLLIAAARSMLGAIDERFQLPGGEQSRGELRKADAELRTIEATFQPSAGTFYRWYAHWPERKRVLRSAQGQSYFSEAVVRRALGN